MANHPLDPPPLRRRWPALLLVGLVAAGLSVAALEKYRQPEMFRLWGGISLRGVLDPAMHATRGAVQIARQLARARSLALENQRLRNELTETRLAAQFTAEELRRVQRLSGLGQWSGPPELSFMMADVIGLVTNEESAEMVINRGSAEGVRPRDPVVALGGLIGLVQTVDAHTAHVQALSDPLSAVGAVATQSRARGVVYGRGRGKPLEFIPENEVQPIEVGSTLVTSGFENSVYPKGIVVGRITAREANMYGMPYGAVQPVVPFESIEEVLLVIPRRRSGGLISTETLGRFAIQIPTLAATAATTSATTPTLASPGTPERATTPTLATTGTLMPATTATLSTTGSRQRQTTGTLAGRGTPTTPTLPLHRAARTTGPVINVIKPVHQTRREPAAAPPVAPQPPGRAGNPNDEPLPAPAEVR